MSMPVSSPISIGPSVTILIWIWPVIRSELRSRYLPVFVQNEADAAVLAHSGFHRCPPSVSRTRSFSSVTLRRTPRDAMAPVSPVAFPVASSFRLPEKTLYLTGDTIWYDGTARCIYLSARFIANTGAATAARAPHHGHRRSAGHASRHPQSPDRHTPGQCSHNLFTHVIYYRSSWNWRTILRHQYSGRWRNTDILI